MSGPKQPVNEETPLLSSSSQSEDLSTKRSPRETIRLAMTSGAGLIADGYDLMVINLALAMLTSLYPAEMSPMSQGLIVSFTLVGVIVGQLFFGVAADIIGRRVASITTATLMLLGAGLSSSVITSQSLPAQLALCRFIMGLGIGGEYPLSATLAKEVETRDGEGLVCSRTQVLVVNMVLFSIGSALQTLLVLLMLSFSVPLQVMWRISLAGGMLPSGLALIMRLQMSEPATSRELAGRRTSEESSASSLYLESLFKVVGPKGWTLLGGCVCWFLYNFTCYSQSSFSHLFVDEAFGKTTDTLRMTLYRDASFALATSLAGFLGSFLAFPMLQSMSTRAVQATGFGMMAAMTLATSALLGLQDRRPITMVGSGLLGSMATSVVGVTTYLVPSENFPPVVRASCVGLSAASGKVGAAVGTAIYPLLVASAGMQVVMNWAGAVMILAGLATMMLIPGSFTEMEKA